MNRLLDGDTFSSDPMEMTPPGASARVRIPFSYGLSKAGLAVYTMQLAKQLGGNLYKP